jgi:hypothetical protein
MSITGHLFLSLSISILTSILVASIAWAIILSCPGTGAGIDAVKHVWLGAGYACQRQLGPSALLEIPLTFWFMLLHTIIGFLLLSFTKMPHSKIVRTVYLGTAIFLTYQIMFFFL